MIGSYLLKNHIDLQLELTHDVGIEVRTFCVVENPHKIFDSPKIELQKAYCWWEDLRIT